MARVKNSRRLLRTYQFQQRIRVNLPFKHSFINNYMLYLVAAAVLAAIILGSVVIFQTNLKQERPDAIAAAIEFERTSLDFGIVPQGEVVSAQYNFKNRGQDMLTIDKILTDCGCTPSSVSTRRIKPGESGTITVEFDTSNRYGWQTRKFLVETNDPIDPKTKLELRGKVKQIISSYPSILRLGKIHKGQKIEKQIKVSIQENKTDIIAELDSESQNITLLKKKQPNSLNERSRDNGIDEQYHKPNNPAQKYILTVSLSTNDMPVGPFRNQIIITAPELNNLRFRIPIRGEIVSEMVVEPLQLIFGVVKPRSTQKRLVKISKWDQTPFVIERIETNIDGLEAEFVSGIAKKLHTLEVKYVAMDNWEEDENIKGKLFVHMINNELVLEIPSYMMLRK